MINYADREDVLTDQQNIEKSNRIRDGNGRKSKSLTLGIRSHVRPPVVSRGNAPLGCQGTKPP